VLAAATLEDALQTNEEQPDTTHQGGGLVVVMKMEYLPYRTIKPQELCLFDSRQIEHGAAQKQ